MLPGSAMRANADITSCGPREAYDGRRTAHAAAIGSGGRERDGDLLRRENSFIVQGEGVYWDDSQRWAGERRRYPAPMW